MNTRKYIPYDREESLDISETDEEQLYAESLGSSKFKSAATSYRSPHVSFHLFDSHQGHG